MKGPETKIKDEIRKWLREQGAYVFSPTQMGYGTQTLDLLVCFRGWFIGIEVKAPSKKLTPRQRLIAEEIKAAEGASLVVHSLVEVIGFIEGLTEQ